MESEYKEVDNRAECTIPRNQIQNCINSVLGHDCVGLRSGLVNTGSGFSIFGATYGPVIGTINFGLLVGALGMIGWLVAQALTPIPPPPLPLSSKFRKILSNGTMRRKLVRAAAKILKRNPKLKEKLKKAIQQKKALR